MASEESGWDWLTAEYMEKVLRRYLNDNGIRVQRLVSKPASAKGDNYSSIMTRLEVHYTDAKARKQSSAYIMKTNFSSHSAAAKMLNQYAVFDHEMDIYERITPKLAKILREVNDAENNEQLFAKAICTDRAHHSIIFEDLTLDGYVVGNRIARLDLEHAKLLLRQLAKFHAAGAVLNEREPHSFTHGFDRGFFNRHCTGLSPIMLGLLRALTRAVAKSPTLKEKYHEKLLRLQENFMEYGQRAFDVDTSDFMTLNHGDYWTSNLMFKYDADKSLLNAIPIDLQYSVWCSPAVDLHYFFNTSLKEELRLSCQDELVHYYYEHLCALLKELRFHGRVPCLHDFYLQYKKRSFIALFAAFTFQPTMIYDGSAECNIENFLIDTEETKKIKDDIFKHKAVQTSVSSLLPYFDHVGLLDVMD